MDPNPSPAITFDQKSKQGSKSQIKLHTKVDALVTSWPCTARYGNKMGAAGRFKKRLLSVVCLELFKYNELN